MDRRGFIGSLAAGLYAVHGLTREQVATAQSHPTPAVEEPGVIPIDVAFFALIPFVAAKHPRMAKFPHTRSYSLMIPDAVPTNVHTFTMTLGGVSMAQGEGLINWLRCHPDNINVGGDRFEELPPSAVLTEVAESWVSYDGYTVMKPKGTDAALLRAR